MKLLHLIALLAGVCLMASSHADTITAVCNPKPPSNSVAAGMQSCTVVNGLPQASITVLVPVVTLVDNTAYRLVLNLTGSGNGDIVMVTAGTVPVGTSCDANKFIDINGINYYRVDRTLVTFSGNQKPPAVFAKC